MSEKLGADLALECVDGAQDHRAARLAGEWDAEVTPDDRHASLDTEELAELRVGEVELILQVGEGDGGRDSTVGQGCR